jgi:hypothetical protein
MIVELIQSVESPRIRQSSQPLFQALLPAQPRHYQPYLLPTGVYLHITNVFRLHKDPSREVIKFQSELRKVEDFDTKVRLAVS